MSSENGTTLHAPRSLADGLRSALADDLVLRVPGVYDGISARIAAELGFRALYVSGAATAASHGFPDMSLVTATELTTSVRTVTASAPQAWVVVDIDTGYGGIPSLRRLVAELRALGVAALHVEDQTFPKRCGFMGPETFVSIDDMSARIRAAADQPGGPVVIARSDTLLGEGMAPTLTRVEAYQAAGAEMIMVNGITDVAELTEVAKIARVPLLHNVSGSDRSPDITDDEARQIGVKMVIYPIHAARAAAEAARRMLRVISLGQNRESVPTLTFEEYFRLAGWDEVEQFEQRMYGGDEL